MAGNPLGKIGRCIRDRREAIEMNQRTLGRRAGICVSHVSMIENAKKAPSLTVFIRIAAVLGCTAGYLLGEVAHGR